MLSTFAHRLPQALETAAQRVKHAVRQAVERSIEGLGLAALAAHHMAQRSDLLEAQFELNRKSAIFILAFDEAFEDKLRADTTPRRTLAQNTTEWTELTLMDDREVESKVAAERLGLQMGHACEWELRELQGYLAPLADGAAAESEHNPLRPELLGLALIRATEKISDRDEVRRVLVAELARSFGDALSALYRSIVADWRSQGLKPAGLTLRHADSRSGRTGADSGFGSSHSGHDDFHSTSSPASLGRTSSGFGSSGHGGAPSLQGQLAASRHGSHAAAGHHGGQAAQGGHSGHGGATMGQVDPAMMGLIRRLAFVDVNSFASTESPGLADGSLLRHAAPNNLIHAHREELRAVSSGSLDHLVIDVIGTLFDQILSDPKVPPQIARQLARLQLPVLRAALGDPGFFSSRRHPVRRFVNRLASLAAAFEDLDGPRGLAFLAKVGELVQAIVEGDFEQIGTYDAQLATLEAFVADQARREVEEASGVASLLQAKEDEIRLQRLYANQLQAELRQLEGPEFLREFIAEVWSRVILRAAADPQAAERLKDLRHTAGELFMSVQPKTSRAQRDAFLAALPKLMQALNAGLNLIAWPEPARRDFFGRLLPAHAEALKQVGRPLDYNLLARRVESTLERAPPSRADLGAAPLAELPTLTDAVLEAPFAAGEAQRVGLVREAAVDWNKAVDIDLGAEPELSARDTQIEGLPQPAADAGELAEPTRGRSLADHVQIGFAYQMFRENQWQKVRLAHVSSARTFFVFTFGGRHQQTISLTYRMLARLCETGRLRAFENAFLLERATARARQQLAQLGHAGADGSQRPAAPLPQGLRQQAGVLASRVGAAVSAAVRPR